MKISIKYGGKILNLPSKVAELTPRASYEDLAVIINLFSYSEYFDSFDRVLETFSSRTGIGADRVLKSLAFWVKEGVIEAEGIKDCAPAITVSNKVPTYSGAQISRFMEENKKIASLFDACQQIMGKIFTPVDYNNLIYIKEYFSLSDDYIMLLLSHCVENEKDGWAYIRKLVKNLYDEGITTYVKLERHLDDRKNKASYEYKMRSIFGIGARELTKKEQERFDLWASYGYGEDIIKRAYEMTVNATGKPSIPYASKIIESWISQGIKSLEEIDALDKKRKNKASFSTFDTDDFFEAALERSEELYKKIREEAKK